MKKLGLIAILVAGSLFASSISDSSNEQLNSMIAGADAKTLSEISFEIHKRAGKLDSQIADIRGDFREQMRKKMSAMSPDERVKFMQEYRAMMSDKIDALSVKEAREMGFYAYRAGQSNGHGWHHKSGKGHKMKAHQNCNQNFNCGMNQAQGMGMNKNGAQGYGTGFGCMWQ